MLKYILAIICNVFLCANLAVCSVPTGYGEFSVTYTNGSETLVYVATNGSDTTGDGSLGNPWGTLEKALSMVSANTVIYVRGGSYPYCQKLGMSGWSNWVTVKNYPGETASFDGIDFSFNYLSYPSNFRIDGISINLTGSTHNQGLNFRYGKNIEVRNVKFVGYDKYLSEYGIKLTSVENVLVYRCDVSKAVAGIYTLGTASYICKNITIAENTVHDLSGATPYSYSSYCDNGVVKNNLFYNSRWISGETNAPTLQTHGSCMSIRSSNVLFDSNTCHSLGSSSAIMTYTDSGSASSYNDIYLTNNVFYDIINEYIIRLYNTATNIVVDHNTVIGSFGDDTGSWKLQEGIVVHSLYSGYDGSGISVTNNIVAARSIIPDTSVIKNNIFYSFCFFSDPYNTVGEVADNTILTNTTSYEPTDYFSVGFFKGTPNFNPINGSVVDYDLDSASPAINVGYNTRLTYDIVGRLRDSTPDIGAFEYILPHVGVKMIKTDGSHLKINGKPVVLLWN